MYVDMNKVYAYTMLPITIEQTKQGEISRIMWQNDIWGIIRFVNCVTIKISDIEQIIRLKHMALIPNGTDANNKTKATIFFQISDFKE